MPKTTKLADGSTELELTPEEIERASAPLYPHEPTAEEVAEAKIEEAVAKAVAKVAPQEVEPETAPEEPETVQPAESKSGVDAGDEDETLDPELVALARSYGFDEDDLELHTSNESLGLAMRPFEKRFMSRVQEQQAKSTETQAPVKPSEPEKKAPAVTPAEELDDPELGIDPEIMDEQVIKVFKTMNARQKALASELSEAKQFIQAVREEEQRKFWRAETEKFDLVVESLNDPELFGPEDARKRTRDQMEARNKLWQATGVTRFGAVQEAQERGQPIQPPAISKALVSRAKLLAFPEKFKEQERAKLQAALQKQSRKRTGKPQSTRVRAPDPKGSEADNRAYLIAEYNKRAAGQTA